MAFDNDESGKISAKKLSERLASELDETEVIHIVENLTMDMKCKSTNVKDANKALVKGMPKV
ncbi:MAG: hypothetical protein LBU35_02595 [Holosporales bacterium]|nr:hypothetical protein [Holosporales bacterium]